MSIATTKTIATMAKGLTGAAFLLMLGGCDREETPPEPAASEPAPEQTSIMRDDLEGTILPPEPQPSPLEARISFSDGGAELSELARAELASILRSPQIAQGGPILLRAHSDTAGGDEVNLRSSRQRGGAVRDYLVENGISEERITIVAFGEQNPLQPNALPDGTPNERGRAANRRVEVLVALTGGDESKPRDLSSSDEAPEADLD